MDLRKQLWPEVVDHELWQRKQSNGFTTIPRTIPFILNIMDALSKGRPVSGAYLDLWCRSYDECFVVLNRPVEMAFSAGFSGQRAEQTWLSRIKILSDLGFVKVKSGPSGPMSYALIPNPYKIAKRLYDAKTEGFPEDIYNALLQRMTEIGAEDLSDTSKPQQQEVATAV